ncbi:EAL domain-containing protein [Oxalobacteraceae bacterium OM1]|nr:EAL domain-containing protein [Oxalobacteraceae bacterium OM1]
MPTDNPGEQGVSTAASAEFETCPAGSLDRAVFALRTLSAGNRALLRATDEAQLLRDMCDVAIAAGGYCGAGVVYAGDDSAKELQWMDWSVRRDGMAVGVDVTEVNRAGLTWDDTPLGQTAVAMAIRTQAPCIGRNLLANPVYEHPAYHPLKTLAEQAGFAAITALPLTYGGKALGAIFIAASEMDAFRDEELRLLGELADDLAFGIWALRTRAEHRQALATIERLAYCDPHTGLPNRTRLLQELDAALKRGVAEQQPVAMLHLRIDRFQEVHQALGFHASNELIQQLGQRIAELLQNGITLARIADDSFGIVLPGFAQQDAALFASGLSHAVEGAVVIAGVPVDLPLRAGLAVYAPASGEPPEPEVLVRHATAALQQHTLAYGRVRIYIDDHARESASQLALMGELRHAIEHDELRLYCQPKVDIRSGCVQGAEALVRWQHPRHGMIAPSRFVKLAEQSGMIAALTSWLLHASFGQVREWQHAGMDQTLAINLSAYDLHDPSLPRHVEHLLSAWGVRPSLVQFELTESALIDEPAAALEALARLKSLGVGILIDDFGTGYSSLSYLQKYPIDGIKIDQSFVMPMHRSQDSAVIVRSTIELGHNLGMEVVAEGVEDEAIWELLAAEGCDIAQGYFIGKPMPVHEFMQWKSAWTARA